MDGYGSAPSIPLHVKQNAIDRIKKATSQWKVQK